MKVYAHPDDKKNCKSINEISCWNIVICKCINNSVSLYYLQNKRIIKGKYKRNTHIKNYNSVHGEFITAVYFRYIHR